MLSWVHQFAPLSSLKTNNALWSTLIKKWKKYIYECKYTNYDNTVQYKSKIQVEILKNRRLHCVWWVSFFVLSNCTWHSCFWVGRLHYSQPVYEVLDSVHLLCDDKQITMLTKALVQRMKACCWYPSFRTATCSACRNALTRTTVSFFCRNCYVLLEDGKSLTLCKHFYNHRGKRILLLLPDQQTNLQMFFFPGVIKKLVIVKSDKESTTVLRSTVFDCRLWF